MPAPRALWLLVLAAFGLRLGLMAYLGDATGFHQAAKSARGVVWDWGYEQAAIAQALADGRGFSDPFQRGSGATGWCAPLYPALLALLLRVTGGVTYSAALALAVLQAAAAALTCQQLFRLARALHSPRLGWLAAAAFALHPLAAYLPVSLVWDSTFVALGVTWFLARLAEAGPSAPPRAILAHGVRLGLVALVNPAPLSLAPAVLWYLARGRGARAMVGVAAAFGGALALTVSPWALRNALTLGSPNLRTNLGVELFVGNNDGARGPFNGRIHPAYDDAEYQRYLELGEVAYARDAGARALAWARADPARFLALSAHRAQRFWVGPDPREPERLGSGALRHRDAEGWIEWLTHALAGALAIVGALRFRGPGAALVRGALFLFPLVYYVTHVFERYRFPIEPVVVLAAVSVLVPRPTKP